MNYIEFCPLKPICYQLSYATQIPQLSPGIDARDLIILYSHVVQ
jgi:hypothetical protein